MIAHGKTMPLACTQKPTKPAIATRPCLSSAWRSQPIEPCSPKSKRLRPVKPRGSQKPRPGKPAWSSSSVRSLTVSMTGATAREAVARGSDTGEKPTVAWVRASILSVGDGRKCQMGYLGHRHLSFNLTPSVT